MTMGVSAKSMTRKELATYASSLKGKKKSDLKKAVYTLITPKKVLEYGSGEGKTWSGFYKTDRYDDNRCRDRYSNEEFYFENTTKSIKGMNIEHSFPKSWWGGEKNNAYQDLFNLMPCEAGINRSKSNFGMGKVGNAKVDNGCTKVGTGVGSQSSTNLWEPADKWKGDFSRGYMYMATAHQDLHDQYVREGLNSLENNEWPTLQEWAYKLYLKWTRWDKVDKIEIERNNAVHDIQDNRNLFVDYPMLAEYIWGDSINVAFDPEKSITTASDDDRYAGVKSIVPDDNPDGGVDPGTEDPGDNPGEKPGGQGGTVTGDEAVVTFDFTNPKSIGIPAPETGKETKIGSNTYSVGGITFSATTAEGSTDTRIWNAKGYYTLRVYKDGTITFTAPEDYVIKNVDFKYGKYSKGSFGSAKPGSLSSDGLKWTGKNRSVTFTTGKSIQVLSAKITVAKLKPTSISTPAIVMESNVVYNLAGQAVGEDYKGIVIKNGKKYIRR